MNTVHSENDNGHAKAYLKAGDKKGAINSYQTSLKKYNGTDYEALKEPEKLQSKP